MNEHEFLRIRNQTDDLPERKQQENAALELLEEIETGSSTKYEARVILYNDDFHSFEEVITQLIKAINCSTQRAVYLTMKAHNEGKAEVFTGKYSKCIRVSSILEEIALRTEIVY
ncbi:MAG: ATP-dependent Clp protease adaptor ClpS [Ignavibacteriales bacterium]|nr:MAG: ATP-dependent Clp protease adaptor ClpS [Ignavibacteriaceae bacterium]MBW7874221.1 ATP-dependent Clp protease adaptor ClpS [Ignavibacteria bacterium]MCZ2142307.1 ATP-dependent Clp protease adaptor ClpS [Ignavibacteriales bacterium]OQY79569.1 MAG: hypothetical protein B6D45_00560 [Ignavibacteriales bacterium UTCHB3]MBV6445191.1 ATP-dependent Clp protease adapter protein ClpS [Ignavibacteriaceae bacterium]